MSISDLLSLSQHLEVQSGTVSGYIATSATTSVTVRATIYTPQGANAQRSIVSTNVNDTAAGTGARTILITYLSTDMASYKTDTVTLNGTTAVNTNATDIALIEKMTVATSGSSGGNAGTINFLTGLAGAGSIWGSIATGDGQTFWCHHYVITGKTFYIAAVTAAATATNGQVSILQIANPTSVPQGPQLQVVSTYLHGNQTTAGFPPVDKEIQAANPIVGPAIIFLNERPAAVTASTTHASFEYIQF
jgi:hypothetical protein